MQLVPYAGHAAGVLMYRNNHYVPEWYQKRFIPVGAKQSRYFHLNLKPELVVSNGHRYRRNALHTWGSEKCFCEFDLYTTRSRDWISTEIEEKFFGPVDQAAIDAVEYFENFRHPSADGKAFNNLLIYLSLQKLRTPKGLAALSEAFGRHTSRNAILILLQKYQQMYCATWAEAVWCILDASRSPTKFIISDHPVTVYNQSAYPASRQCRGYGDPDVRLSGTHTLFALSPNKMLVLTNLSWVRHPYGSPAKLRPNPGLFRPTFFDFQDIQTGRCLDESEVLRINHIVKSRAYRYIAGGRKEWLFPERYFSPPEWNEYGKSYLLMPDPRAMTFSDEVYIGYSNKRSDGFDAYGHRAGQRGFSDSARKEREWETFHAFQGEFARRFGPVRRGQTFRFGRLSEYSDEDDAHKYYLDLEQKNRKFRYER